MKISCIIPTRNRRHMALAALDSVRHQQLDNLEVVLVDDGSIDHTLAEAKRQYPEVKTLRLTGVGPGPARNAGFAASTGDIIMFLDSDDLWLDNHAKRLADTLNRGYDVAYGVAESLNEIDGSVFFIPENGTGFEGDCFDHLTRWCFLVPSAMALTRRAFIEAGPFPTLACGEDWIFFLKLAAIYPFGFAGPEPVTLRRLHRQSLCFLNDRKKLLAIINQVLTFLQDEPRATTAHRNRFKQLHRWTAAHSCQWVTVQDWYLSLLQENLI